MSYIFLGIWLVLLSAGACFSIGCFLILYRFCKIFNKMFGDKFGGDLI